VVYLATEKLFDTFLQEKQFPCGASPATIRIYSKQCPLKIIFIIDNRDSFRAKLAILTSLDRQFDKVKFLELYAGNRGFQIGAFVDFEEALYWLVAPIEMPGFELYKAR
jgi:hypothetical protein